MKRIFISFCLLSIFFLLSACKSETVTAPTIAVVNTAQVFQDCEAGKEAVKYLENIAEIMQAELKILQDALQNNPGEEAQVKFQTKLMEFQQLMNAEQQQVFTALNEVYQKTIDDYRIKNNLLVIVKAEQVASMDSAIDISVKIIEDINKQKVEFKSIAPETNQSVTAPATENKAENKAENKTESKSAESKADEKVQ